MPTENSAAKVNGPNLPRTFGVGLSALILAWRLLSEIPVSTLYFFGALMAGVVGWAACHWLIAICKWLYEPLSTRQLASSDSVLLPKEEEEQSITYDFIQNGQRTLVRKEVPEELRVTDGFLSSWATLGRREFSRELLKGLGLPERSYSGFLSWLREGGLVSALPSGGYELNGPGRAWLRSKMNGHLIEVTGE